MCTFHCTYIFYLLADQLLLIFRVHGWPLRVLNKAVTLSHPQISLRHTCVHPVFMLCLQYPSTHDPAQLIPAQRSVLSIYIYIDSSL
jgi:hypothetical protein